MSESYIYQEFSAQIAGFFVALGLMPIPGFIKLLQNLRERV